MLSAAVTAACLLAAYCTWNYALKLKSVNYLPGMRPTVSPLNAFGAFMPTSRWNLGINWAWLWRKTAYFDHKHDVISVVPFIGQPTYYTCSLSVMKQILKDENKLGIIKPPEMTLVLSFWGQNLVSVNGDAWKRHRRILGPAFTTKTYDLVWQQTASLYEEMIQSSKWEEENVVVVRNINQYIRSFTLIIISRCGFGLPMLWKDPNVEHTEEKMSFAVALEWVSVTSIARLVLPRWSYRLPIKWVRDMEHAWSLLAEYMDTFIETKAQELSGLPDGDESAQRGDIFTRLVAAMDDSAKTGLDKQEVIGNTFTLMFAGHETTANVLSATLGFLAVHQDEQEKAYQEILAATPSDRQMGVEDLAQLTHTMACFYESGRMYPPATMIARDVPDDMALKVTSPAEGTVVIGRGSRIIIDMIATHHNPNVFPEPDVWRPSRWYDVSEHELTMFSTGPRACIGRKFGQVEATCFLVHFLRQWKIDVELGDGETRERYREQMMETAGFAGLTFGVGSLDLKLVARK